MPPHINNILKQAHNMLLFIFHKTVSCIKPTKYTDTTIHNSSMPMHVLQNREHEKGITRGPQKYDEQMMAMEYIDNEAKIDDTSAFTITSPPFLISPDLKKSPISGSQHVTKHNLNFCDIEASDHESVSHQTSHSVSASLPDVMWCRKCHLRTIVHYPFLLRKRTTNLLTKIA